jgi:hypothetical protein
VSEDEYDAWWAGAGFKRTGDGTNITEEWTDGTRHIYMTRPSHLSLDDRREAIERAKMYLGIDYNGRRGVH